MHVSPPQYGSELKGMLPSGAEDINYKISVWKALFDGFEKMDGTTGDSDGKVCVCVCVHVLPFHLLYRLSSSLTSPPLFLFLLLPIKIIHEMLPKKAKQMFQRMLLNDNQMDQPTQLSSLC